MNSLRDYVTVSIGGVLAVIEFYKQVKEENDNYFETEWKMRTLTNPPSKLIYYNLLHQWVLNYIKKNVPLTGFNNFVIIQAGVLKHVIPCRKECPKVNVSQLVSNFYSTHTNLTVPEKATLTYVNIKKDNATNIEASITKYLLKASDDYEIYWLRNYEKIRKLTKTIKIQLKKINIAETIKNKELVNLVYYNLFNINKSTYEDALELLKATNPDGVIYFKLFLSNNLTDYIDPTKNIKTMTIEEKYILDMPDVFFSKL